LIVFLTTINFDFYYEKNFLTLTLTRKRQIYKLTAKWSDISVTRRTESLSAAFLGASQRSLYSGSNESLAAPVVQPSTHIPSFSHKRRWVTASTWTIHVAIF